MASTFTLSVDIQIVSGPKMSYTLSEPIEAYDVTDVVIPKNTTTGKEVPIQPSGPGKVRILAITASRYQDLKYKTKDGTGTGTVEVVLDAPQLFVAGTVGILEKTPQALVVTNTSTTEDAALRILVGRKI